MEIFLPKNKKKKGKPLTCVNSTAHVSYILKLSSIFIFVVNLNIICVIKYLHMYYVLCNIHDVIIVSNIFYLLYLILIYVYVNILLFWVQICIYLYISLQDVIHYLMKWLITFMCIFILNKKGEHPLNQLIITWKNLRGYLHSCAWYWEYRYVHGEHREGGKAFFSHFILLPYLLVRPRVRTFDTVPNSRSM